MVKHGQMAHHVKNKASGSGPVKRSHFEIVQWFNTVYTRVRKVTYWTGLQWACNKTEQRKTKPMQKYIPFAAVPKTNIRSPQTTLLHKREKRRVQYTENPVDQWPGYIAAHTAVGDKKMQLKKSGSGVEGIGSKYSFITVRRGQVENKQGPTESRSEKWKEVVTWVWM